MALDKAAILAHAGVCETREVHVPAWRNEAGDDTVVVRGMTTREWEINQASLGDKEGENTAAVLARCIVAGMGSSVRVFTDDDIPFVSSLPWAQVQKLSQAVADLSGLNGDDEPDAEAAKGNSDAAPGGVSSSD